MRKLLRAYKVEIKPTRKQIEKTNQSIGVCRWLYNHYLFTNSQLYSQYKEGFIEGIKTLNKVEKVKFKFKNIKNYINIEWALIKNTIKYIIYKIVKKSKI